MEMSPIIRNLLISSLVLSGTTVFASEGDENSAANGATAQTNMFQWDAGADREQMAIEILTIFGPQSADNGGQLSIALKKASIEQLKAMREAPDMQTVNRILGGTDSNLAQRVGDTHRDYSFTPITPCRLLDTRVVGGKFSANQVREYYVYGAADIENQGGSVGGCDSPVGEPRGVVVKLTSIPTPGSSGTFSVYPQNESAPAVGSIINYGLAKLDHVNEIKVVNTAPVKTFHGIGPKEIKVLNKFGTSHLIMDVLGYYSAPEVPAIGVQYVSGDQRIELSGVSRTVKNLTVTMPTDGHCVINASAYFNFNGANSTGRCKITTGNTVDSSNVLIGFIGSGVTFATMPIAGTRGFPQAAGSQTYNFVCDEQGGQVQVVDTQMTATCTANLY